MKRLACLAGIFFSIIFGVYAEVSKDSKDPEVSKVSKVPELSKVPGNSKDSPIEQHALLALSSPDYRVTAGDMYTLTYAAEGKAVIYVIVVDSSYRVRVSNLGIVNAAGKTYRQFKTEAEAIVTNNYPLSGVQLVLTQPALFTVYVSGEVLEPREYSAWALARLSSLMDGALSAYSSIRDITVIPMSGQSKTYDLFKAQRDGDLGQDPYLRPGDTVKVNRIDRVVAVHGAVERPGEYQLLPGENLSDLILRYASGLEPVADPSRIELVRHIETETDSGDKIYLTGQDIQDNYPLHHLDELTVPSIIDLIPVMFVEGAVQESSDSLVIAGSNVANRLTVRFNHGENYASLVQRNRVWFTAISDTQNAYVIRGAERIPLNINPMLYDSSYRSQYFVERNDVLIIPFRQYFVTVAGAVAVPGRYPYIPDRGWDYYVALAGGFVMERNSRESVAIQDIGGRVMKKTDPVSPETIITARTNAGLYYFNHYAPVVTTMLSIVTTFISVTLLVSR
ncbi:polysaccharide biosynthesis/export protein [Treponema primitia ZAS-2]|uniref:Polysaccharide biosynthesis/export protein n=1 Tax=Treponema primitia (strain ATCC BAA-887 / DSM 12427 / ZAS-2) TaxID=545694 RepID=F5YN19_TREPZ|nr:SLBB domain-containing protein [Treponema primitia]AEF84328.1 polysaccharide biosynthesis/export protein [Treponema primitia ZAS-2]